MIETLAIRRDLRYVRNAAGSEATLVFGVPDKVSGRARALAPAAPHPELPNIKMRHLWRRSFSDRSNGAFAL